ncbi:DUF3047 domain-containing protein [Janthinobacterium sp. 17J80-10]|uniref:DUF3047 domain-containing protein n=1 Tax=Janthinobacterium sp. 17J80-10 TaxID=2497863 RepID=UPI0010054363|nr:DUF3047 domain-containing protein [Janthinobacterium sp. 17J80-10]QAU35776.1 DUF3047 domain-containing protein [Janthinobacterium sp. 17J80-10]
MKRICTLLAASLAVAGCAFGPPAEQRAESVKAEQDTQGVAPLSMFSSGPAGGLPNGWMPMVIFKHKNRTDYSLVAERDRTVLRAFSSNASSGLMQRVSIDPQEQPLLRWQWKIGTLGESIAHAQELMEDTPARIILGFDGDKESLSFSEQILFETAKLITGHEFPYATLMYEWHGKEPAGTIRHSKRSSRIRHVVVENGTDSVGKWREFERNIIEDFERAYGEKPGRLIGVGILTDSDFTGESVETWYGDIRLLSQNR